jgi:prepilin-type N-terminal cleavage/methylation domain-containing protein
MRRGHLQMLKQKKSKLSGFTIIEVMIVLAIAGLILLIVFLAVPALERNAHNTSAKNDVSSVLAGMNEYVNNNNGTLPIAQASLGSGTTGYIGDNGNALTCSGTTSTVNCAQVKVGYYDASKVSIVTTAPSTLTLGNVYIVLGASCNGNAVSAGTSPRGYAALYLLEGNAKECQAS